VQGSLVYYHKYRQYWYKYDGWIGEASLATEETEEALWPLLLLELLLLELMWLLLLLELLLLELLRLLLLLELLRLLLLELLLLATLRLVEKVEKVELGRGLPEHGRLDAQRRVGTIELDSGQLRGLDIASDLGRRVQASLLVLQRKSQSVNELNTLD
jgi:hypothetical protein